MCKNNAYIFTPMCKNNARETVIIKASRVY